MTTYSEQGCPTPDDCADPYHNHKSTQSPDDEITSAEGGPVFMNAPAQSPDKPIWPLGRDNPDCICGKNPNINCDVHVTKMSPTSVKSPDKDYQPHRQGLHSDDSPYPGEPMCYCDKPTPTTNQPQEIGERRKITFDDQLEHCLGSLISIVRETHSFDDNPAKQTRQLARNISAKEQAKTTLKSIVTTAQNKARLGELEGALKSLRLYTARKYGDRVAGESPTTYLKDRINQLKKEL